MRCSRCENPIRHVYIHDSEPYCYACYEKIMDLVHEKEPDAQDTEAEEDKNPEI